MEGANTERYKKCQAIFQYLCEEGLSKVEAKKIANNTKSISEAFSVVENEYWWRDDYELEWGKVAAILKRKGVTL